MSKANADKSFDELSEDFRESLANFMDQTDGLSKNGLKRVCKALTAYPLEEDVVELVNQDEIELFSTGTEIQSIKMSMMVESLKRDAEEALNGKA